MRYFDTSALAKLILTEPETAVSRQLFESTESVVSSVLAEIELTRAARRAGLRGGDLARVEHVLARVALLDLDREVRARARSLDPEDLRSLDAIHLASALSLGGLVNDFVTFDVRLARAARAAGLTVVPKSRR